MLHKVQACLAGRAPDGDLGLQMCLHADLVPVRCLPAVYEAVLVGCLKCHSVLLQQGQSAADMPPTSQRGV